MSHVVTAKVKVKDPAAFEAAAKELGHEVLGQGTYRLYSGEVKGLGVKLPGWRYPVVVEPNGNVKFDDFEGRWGDRRQLDGLMQNYTLRKARAATLAHVRGARFLGQHVAADGSVVLEYETR